MIPQHLKRKSNWTYKFPEYSSDWKFIADECKKRDNYTCQDCGKVFINDKYKLHATHIISKSKGGQDILSNLISKCIFCHSRSTKHQHMKKRIKEI